MSPVQELQELQKQYPNLKPVHWIMSDKQCEALQILKSPETDELLFGGAKSGGKSILGCRWAYIQAANIINKVKLKPSNILFVVVFIAILIVFILLIIVIKKYKKGIHKYSSVKKRQK